MNWMHRIKTALCATAAASLLGACAPLLGIVSEPQHPLVDKIWDVAGNRFVEPSVVFERAASARFALLGEIHDSKEHHRIQTRILEEMIERGRRPALVMEQYDFDQQQRIDQIVRADLSQDDKLDQIGTLMRKTWDWPAYEPLVELALERTLPLAASNLSRNELRQISRNGFSVFGEEKAERLALEKVWSPQRQEYLLQNIYQAHCGKVKDHVLEAVAKAQRARDAVMADALLNHREAGAVAIFGSGHVRRDMGVPLYLAARAPQLETMVLGLVEVQAPTDPTVYTRSPTGVLYDFIWFTERVKRNSNPCDDMPAMPRPATPPAPAAPAKPQG